MTKLEGGIGTLTRHLEERFAEAGGELLLGTSATGIATDGAVSPASPPTGRPFAAPSSSPPSNPDLTVRSRRRRGCLRRSGRRSRRRRPPRQLRADALRARRRCRSSWRRTSCSTTRRCRAPSACSARRRSSSSSGRTAAAASCPADPAVAFQIPSAQDPSLAPPGKAAASAFSLWFPVEADRPQEYARLKAEMGQRVIDKIGRIAPDFESLILKHTTFTPKHMGTMFGAPGGDWCHGLIHPEQMGAHRPGPQGLARPPARHRRPVSRRCRLPRRAGHHVHPRLQRRPGGARRTGRNGVNGRQSKVKLLSGKFFASRAELTWTSSAAAAPRRWLK